MSKREYKLIPMNEIDPEARMIAILWHENASNWIGDKHKLASDIMNYAAYKLADKDKEIAQIQRLRAMDAADNQKEQYDTNEALKYWKKVAATKEASIKELVEKLEWIEEKTRLDCYTDVDVAEINEMAESLIQKHKQ